MIRETIKEDNIQVLYAPTESMTADIFTKPLGFHLFPLYQRTLLNM
jgi:hypothetical protein